MASEWYLISSQPTYNSGYENEEFNNYAEDGLQELLGESSPISSNVHLVNADLNILSSFRAIVQSNTTDNKVNSTERQIITTIGTLKSGDYILYDTNVYLVISFVGNNKIYEKAVMELTNYTLKFQSPDGTILSYPCIDESSNTVGIDESNTINTLNGIKRIKLPFCLDTDRIKVDDRFFIDRSNRAVFKVVNVNNTEFNYGDKGLIVLTLEADEIQPTDGDKPKDRPDLGICNYFEPTIEPEPVEGYSYAVITCSNPDNEITLGSTSYRTLTPTFYNADGTVVSSITAVWNWELPSDYTNAFTIVYDGNLAKIKVAENYDLLGMMIKANVQNSGGFYRGSINLLIVI